MMAKANIAELLAEIKDAICAIDKNEDPEPHLVRIEADYLELLELIKLFLISERDSYYGYFLMNMQFRTNFRSESVAGIKLNTFPAVFEANPILLCRYTLKEILYIVCHEIDHVVFNHPTEMLKANSEGDPDRFYRFNLAADAAVNDRLNAEIEREKRRFMIAPEGGITSHKLAEMFSLGEILHEQSYAYYFALLEDAAVQAPASDNVLSKPEVSESSTEQDSDFKSIITKKANDSNLGDHRWELEEDAEDTSSLVRELVNAAFDMMSEESRGMMPGHFTSQVDKINTPPKLSWQAILKKYIGTITADSRKTRMRLNRRQPDRFDLSGAVADKTLKILVVVDTSASVDDRMIAQIFREMFAILSKRKYEVTVLEFDAEVQRVYRVYSPADVQRKVLGRGGTYYTSAISYINEDKYFRDALMICFTDGYGEQSIPRPKTYRNIWVVFDDAQHLSLKEPYGVVLSL